MTYEQIYKLLQNTEGLSIPKFFLYCKLREYENIDFPLEFIDKLFEMYFSFMTRTSDYEFQDLDNFVDYLNQKSIDEHCGIIDLDITKLTDEWNFELECRRN